MRNVNSLLLCVLDQELSFNNISAEDSEACKSDCDSYNDENYHKVWNPPTPAELDLNSDSLSSFAGLVECFSFSDTSVSSHSESDTG